MRTRSPGSAVNVMTNQNTKFSASGEIAYFHASCGFLRRYFIRDQPVPLCCAFRCTYDFLLYIFVCLKFNVCIFYCIQRSLVLYSFYRKDMPTAPSPLGEGRGGGLTCPHKKKEKDLGSQEIRKHDENPKIPQNYSLLPSPAPKMKMSMLAKTDGKRKLNFSRKALFHVKTSLSQVFCEWLSFEAVFCF